jgi:hypothetical protein
VTVNVQQKYTLVNALKQLAIVSKARCFLLFTD